MPEGALIPESRGPFYVRQTYSAAWDSISDSTPEDLNFPCEVVGELIDSQMETSVWEVTDLDAPEINHLLAALHSPNAKNLSEMTFRFVSAWRLDQIGLTKRTTTGNSLDSNLNKKHFVIEIRSLRDLLKLAKAFKALPARFYGKRHVIHQYSIAIREQRISPPGERGMWKLLVDSGCIEFRTEIGASTQ
jgi:hypothetical protein